MDISAIEKFLYGFQEWGIFALGWVAFFWTQIELRRARAAHDKLVYELVATVAKLELIGRKSDDSAISG
jgi:hypothetical protein